MIALVTQVINGVSIGSMYAMVAIGYTLIIGILNMLNFAHHQVFMVAGYVALWAYVLVTNFVCFRHIERTWHLAPFVTSVAFGSILASPVALYWGFEGHKFVPLFGLGSIAIGSLNIDPSTPVIIATVGLCVLILEIILSRTRLGRAIRAVAVNPETASLMGINAKWIVTIVFFIKIPTSRVQFSRTFHRNMRIEHIEHVKFGY